MTDKRIEFYRPTNKNCENPWYQVLIDQAMIDGIYKEEHENNPRKLLDDIINWEVQIALDPDVSSDAKKLIEQAYDKGYDVGYENGIERERYKY